MEYVELQKVLIRPTSVKNARGFNSMLKDQLLTQCRWSGLTDIRTVSDELSSSGSSGFFSECSDQTMAMTRLKDLEKGLFDFKLKIDTSIAQFINPHDDSDVDEVHDLDSPNAQ